MAAFVPMASISDGFSNSFGYEKRYWKDIKSGFTHFADGDVAVAKISPCLENRKSFVARDLPNGIGSGTTELFVFRSKHILSDYTLLFFKSNYFISECVATFNGVVGQQRAARNVIEKMTFPIPPAPEQKRIVEAVKELFGRIDEIENAKLSAKANLDAAKSRILELAIHGKLVPQDPSDEPAIELLKRINPDFRPSDNLHYNGDLPKGWIFCTIGDVFQHNTGKALNSVATNGQVLRYITTSNLYWDRFDLTDVRTMHFTEKELEKCKAVKGDLLVCEGGDIGRAAVWTSDESIMIQNHIHRLRPKTLVSVRYFYYVFYLYKRIGVIGGKGIAIPGLSSRELAKLVIPVPPVKEQFRIVDKIDNCFSILDEIVAQ